MVCQNVAIGLCHLELLCLIEVFHAVFNAIRHVFQTKILADAIGVDHSSDVELLSGEIGVGLLDIERYDIDALRAVERFFSGL